MANEARINIPDFTGRTLHGRYELTQRIGYGGMATVYAAIDRQIDKPVAVKVLNPQFFHNADYFARFRQEAFSAAKVRHQHLVDVTDFGDDGGVAYFVMELLVGESLSERLHRTAGPMPWTEALDIIGQVCDALAYAHDLGLVHRDIKPGNIFLVERPGRPGQIHVKLLDLGIAKVLREALDLRAAAPETRLSQGTPGTPEYMAPEQAMGHPVDLRTDIYAVGVTLYRMLTGHLPFYSPTSVFEVQRMHVELPPVPLRLLAPDAAIPEEVEAVVLRALAKSPEDRFVSARELVDTLQEAQRLALRRPTVVDDPTTPFRRSSPAGSNMPRVQAAATMAGGLLVMATVFMLVMLFDIPGVKALVARYRGEGPPEFVPLPEPFQSDGAVMPAAPVDLTPIDLFLGRAPEPLVGSRGSAGSNGGGGNGSGGNGSGGNGSGGSGGPASADPIGQARGYVQGKMAGIVVRCKDPRAAAPIVFQIVYDLATGAIEARTPIQSSRSNCVKQALEEAGGKKNLGSGKAKFQLKVSV